MLLHAPRAVVLVCDAAASDVPAVGSACAGYVVVACFTCADLWPSGAVLRELAQVGDALCVDEALVVPRAGAVLGEQLRSVVIPLPRDSNGAAARRRPLS